MEIAKMFGATDRTVRRWLSVYRRNPDSVDPGRQTSM